MDVNQTIVMMKIAIVAVFVLTISFLRRNDVTLALALLRKSVS